MDPGIVRSFTPAFGNLPVTLSPPLYELDDEMMAPLWIAADPFHEQLHVAFGLPGSPYQRIVRFDRRMVQVQTSLENRAPRILLPY